VRTSSDSPLQIAEVAVPGGVGIIGITLCPGKKDAYAGWDRDLAADIAAIKAWGAGAIVTLIEREEFTLLEVPDLPDKVREYGMEWYHLPIRDLSAPSRSFEKAWSLDGPRLCAMLGDGKRVLVHCRGGLGRAGTVAAKLLIECGVAPTEAIALVRRARPGAIETSEQEAYVKSSVPM